MNVFFAEDALHQIEGARAWWRDHMGGGEEAFASHLKRAVDRLVATPGLGSPAANRSGVRRVHVGDLRSFLYYRVDVTRSEIEILALWHTSRGASPKL